VAHPDLGLAAARVAVEAVAEEMEHALQRDVEPDLAEGRVSSVPGSAGRR
jgi:hypothetical protein